MRKSDPAVLAKLLPYYREAERMQELWVHQEEFVRTLDLALLARQDAAPGTELKACAAYFSDYTVVIFIDSAERFLIMLGLLDSEVTRQRLFDLVIGHELVPLSLLSSIAADERIMAPAAVELRDAALRLNARHLIAVAPPASLQVRQLLPETWPVSSHLQQYLLAWAYEEDKLGQEGVDYFKVVFPEKYGVLARIKLRSH